MNNMDSCIRTVFDLIQYYYDRYSLEMTDKVVLILIQIIKRFFLNYI